MAKEFMDHFFGETPVNFDDVQDHSTIRIPSLGKVLPPGPDASIIEEAQQEFAVIHSSQLKYSFHRFVGTVYLIGGAVGCLTGLYKGIREINKNKYTAKMQRTVLLNHVLKEGFVQSNTMAVIGIIYSGVSLLVKHIRPDCDGDFNTIISGTATGMLLKSTDGATKCVLGGIIGMCVSVIYRVYTNF
ncbi:mitochondrial import inner membrane translocase subunit Tim23-like [Teleopsis dalmanni]|uniref:mitochondrial import inner membrane translocase subunit Tim23-like n=1 Tax=Teleopsis dalmanni TaxID=139649 RepID=UPI0018CF3D21|nr:mitochondrial import inner membrane translocase subunit Tim23-like [Teleopsis dalmanni]